MSSMQKLNTAITSEDFATLYDAIMLDQLTNGSAGSFELENLAKFAGVTDERIAHKLVQACMVVAKSQIKAEVRKQTENMLYWVERV